MTKKILILTLMMCLLGGGFFVWVSRPARVSHQYRVFPHFMLASSKLDPLRKELQDRSTSKTPRIIIISPDHFRAFTTNDQMFSGGVRTLCIKGDCTALDGAFLPLRSSALQGKLIHDVLVLSDHGIGSHFSFIKRYFPHSKVVSLLVDPRSFQSFDLLLQQLRVLQEDRETIVIASVDWSHYVSEPWALLHDYSAWTLLLDPHRDNIYWRKMDIDCPVCLSLVDMLAREDGLSPQFRWRDSSGTILGSTGVNMTSRMVISYEQGGTGGLLTGTTLLLGGEISNLLHLIMPGDDGWKQYFQERYQEHNTDSPLSGYYHRLGTSWDVVWVAGAEYAQGNLISLGIEPFPDGDTVIKNTNLSVSVLTNQSELSHFCSHITTPQPSIIVWKGYDRPVVDEFISCPIVLISLLSSGATSITQSGSMTHIALGPVQGLYMDSKQLVGVFIHHDGVQVYTP